MTTFDCKKWRCIYDLQQQNWKLLQSLRNYTIETSPFHMIFSWNSFLEYVLFSKLETFYKLKKTVKDYSRAWKVVCTLVSVGILCKKKMHRNFEILSISKIFERYFTEIIYYCFIDTSLRDICFHSSAMSIFKLCTKLDWLKFAVL